MQATAKTDDAEALAVSQERAAKLLGVSVRTLIRKTNAGEIASGKVGRRRIYAMDELRRVALGRGANG